MWAPGASRLAAPDALPAQPHLGMILLAQGTGPLQLGAGEDEQTPEVVLVEIPDRVQQIPVEGHQATESGANSRVTVRRSVRVQPRGGIMRSAWLEHIGYP